MKEGDVTYEMRIVYISSIFKKGNKNDYANYRLICVTNPMMKLIGQIIRNRLEDQFSTSAEQCGFIAWKSCVDRFFTMRQNLEKEVPLVFIDL